MKKLIKKYAVALTVIAAAIGLMGCNPGVENHSHTFSETWTSDESFHWHAATCGHTEEIRDKSKHIFGEWKITTHPTEETEGAKEHSCSVCNYKTTESVAKLEHSHAKGLHHAAVAGTCTAKGTIEYYDCVKETCKIKLDSDGNPLSLTDGTLDPSNHSGTATSWTKTSTTHKETYDCCNTVKTAEAAHSWNEWNITIQPTEEAEGTKEHSCSVCNYKTTESVAKLEHSHAKGLHHAAVAGTCTAKGTVEYYDCVKEGCEIKLDSDGDPLSSTDGTLDPSNHSGTATSWTKTATTHKEIYDCCVQLKQQKLLTHGMPAKLQKSQLSLLKVKKHTLVLYVRQQKLQLW